MPKRSKMPPRKKKPVIYQRTDVRKIRNAQKKTQVDVAAEMGISHATLGRMERGLLPYSQKHLEALARILNVDIPTLLGQRPEEAEEKIRGIWQRATPDERTLIAQLAETVISRRTP